MDLLYAEVTVCSCNSKVASAYEVQGCTDARALRDRNCWKSRLLHRGHDFMHSQQHEAQASPETPNLSFLVSAEKTLEQCNVNSGAEIAHYSALNRHPYTAVLVEFSNCLWKFDPEVLDKQVGFVRTI